MVALNQPCKDMHSVQFRGNFRLKRNILQWERIRGYESDSTGIFPLLNGTIPALHCLFFGFFFFCPEICYVCLSHGSACRQGACLGEIFALHCVLCQACFSSTSELPSALSCSFARALGIRATESVAYFVSLETVSK